MEFNIYAKGIVSMSVCVSKEMKRKEIENRANSENPTGISSGWHISDDKTFASGESMPCVCENDNTRKHYLLTC
jgi:hypothetical protein